jgi:hypothetical protein
MCRYLIVYSFTRIVALRIATSTHLRCLLDSTNTHALTRELSGPRPLRRAGDIVSKPRIWNHGAKAVSLRTQPTLRVAGSGELANPPTSALLYVGAITSTLDCPFSPVHTICKFSNIRSKPVGYRNPSTTDMIVSSVTDSQCAAAAGLHLWSPESIDQGIGQMEGGNQRAEKYSAREAIARSLSPSPSRPPVRR